MGNGYRTIILNLKLWHTIIKCKKKTLEFEESSEESLDKCNSQEYTIKMVSLLSGLGKTRQLYIKQ